MCPAQKSSRDASVTFPALAALIAASVFALGRGTSIGKPPVSTTLRRNKRMAVLTSRPAALRTAAASRLSSGSTLERTSTVNIRSSLAWLWDGLCSYIVAQPDSESILDGGRRPSRQRRFVSLRPSGRARRWERAGQRRSAGRNPFGRTAFFCRRDQPIGFHRTQDDSHHVAADAGAGFFDFQDRERQVPLEDLGRHKVALGAAVLLVRPQP